MTKCKNKTPPERKEEFIEERKSICDRPEAAGEICVTDDRISKGHGGLPDASTSDRRREEKNDFEKAEEIIRSFEA